MVRKLTERWITYMRQAGSESQHWARRRNLALAIKKIEKKLEKNGR